MDRCCTDFQRDICTPRRRDPARYTIQTVVNCGSTRRTGHTETLLKHQMCAVIAHERVEVPGPGELNIKIDHSFT